MAKLEFPAKIVFAGYMSKICGKVYKRFDKSDICKSSWLRKLYFFTKEKEHSLIFSFLKTDFSELIDKYRNIELIAGDKGDTIWTCWWQGEDNAPPLVKRCIAGIRQNAGGRRVVVIDYRNVEQYVSLPVHIAGKHKQGVISATFLSDIIRLELLARYGGLWIDATYFVFKPIPDSVFSAPLYSPKMLRFDNYLPNQFGNGNPNIQLWANSLIGCRQNHPFCLFALDFLKSYWNKYSTPIAYHLFDYSLKIAYDTIDMVKQDMDALTVNSNERFKLAQSFNLAYNQDIINRIAQSGTLFFKLNRKRKYDVFTKTGEETIYRRFINGIFTYTAD